MCVCVCVNLRFNFVLKFFFFFSSRRVWRHRRGMVHLWNFVHEKKWKQSLLPNTPGLSPSYEHFILFPSPLIFSSLTQKIHTRSIFIFFFASYTPFSSRCLFYFTPQEAVLFFSFFCFSLLPRTSYFLNFLGTSNAYNLDWLFLILLCFLVVFVFICF